MSYSAPYGRFGNSPYDQFNPGLADILRRLGRVEDAAAVGSLGDIFRAYEGTGRTPGVPQTGLLHEVELPSVVEALSDEERRFCGSSRNGKKAARARRLRRLRV